MLPLSLLKAAEDKDILVELKNGDTFHGKLVNCDRFININMKDITLTSSDGEKFWKLDECYIRGSTIKYLRVDQQALDTVDQIDAQSRRRPVNNSRGGRGGNRGGSYNNSGNSYRGRGGSAPGGHRGGASGQPGRGGGGRGNGRGGNRGGSRGGQRGGQRGGRGGDSHGRETSST